MVSTKFMETPKDLVLTDWHEEDDAPLRDAAEAEAVRSRQSCDEGAAPVRDTAEAEAVGSHEPHQGHHGGQKRHGSTAGEEAKSAAKGRELSGRGDAR